MVKNLTFLNILPLHERLIRSIQSNKDIADDGVSYNFDVVNVLEKENVTLATAKLIVFNQKRNVSSLSLAEASKHNRCFFKNGLVGMA